MPLVYVVEDDAAIRGELIEVLERNGLETAACETFDHVVEDIQAAHPDVVLLDLTLPGTDGQFICRELRSVSDVPIMVLTSRVTEIDEVLSMNMGADDFIAKPFDQSVLTAKIQALLRRTYDFAAAVPILEHRGALLNTGDNTLTYEGRQIELSKNEYRILYTLLENKGKVVSREKLMERLWETDSFVDENTLTVNVNRLRKKLDAAGLPGFITTRFGVGYLVE